MTVFTTIHACTTYCRVDEGVEVAPSALPHVLAWLQEHAHEYGYIHVTHANTAAVSQMLHDQETRPYVPDLGDER